MALIFSAASGNFNASATWVGGVVPTVGDEARAATGHTITINVDTTCDEISNAGTGIYTLADGVTLTANCAYKSTTITRSLLQFTAVSPAVGFIVGNVLGGTVSSAFGCNNTSSGTINITGNSTGGSGGTAIGCNNGSTGTINITGNVSGGIGTTAFGCNNAAVSSGTINITGNVTAGSGNGADGCRNNPLGTITVTGNVIAGSGTNSIGCHNASTGTITVTGNVTAGSGTGCQGCQNNSTGTITITGIATGGTTNGAAGANNASTGTLNVGRAKGNDFGIGSSGIAAGVGVASVQASITKIKELEYGLRGMSPTSGPAYLEPALGNIAILVEYPSGSGSKTLSDPNNLAGLSPAITDVRTGIVYNNGNDTGTCAVPPAGSVALGVPVDAGTGLAALTPAAVWGHATRTITGGTVDTLVNAPTVPSAVQIRQEMDSNSTKLANLDATVSSRLAPSGTLAVVTTLTNAPTVPTAAAIATEVWSKPTTELTAAGSIGERSKNQSTVATTGAQLAAALS